MVHFNAHNVVAGKKVLVAPLDWGLGHASRCIPLIRQLLKDGARVWLAAAGPQAAMLHQEFPQLPVLPLEGYNISYSKRALLLRLASQWPAVKRHIASEHAWLQQMQASIGFDLVISDNRYGLWTRTCPSILLTHQLQLALPDWLRPLERSIRKKLFGYIENFHACWVPDFESGICAISGMLGHPKDKPSITVVYLGWLSRFGAGSIALKKYTCTIVLSGPEPQRSIFEKIILARLHLVKGKVLLVRGKPGNNEQLQVPAHVQVHAHLASETMQQAFLESEFIVSRGGYSTLMDAFTLQQKCIVVPTPGQTEQQYLAANLSAKKAVLTFRQQNFKLDEALTLAQSFPFAIPQPADNDWLAPAMHASLQALFTNQPVAGK